MPILFEFADEHYNREHPFPAMTRVIFCINAVDPRFSAWTLSTTHNSKTHIFTVSLPFPYCDDTSFSFLIGSIQSLKSFLSFFFFFFLLFLYSHHFKLMVTWHTTFTCNMHNIIGHLLMVGFRHGIGAHSDIFWFLHFIIRGGSSSFLHLQFPFCLCCICTIPGSHFEFQASRSIVKKIRRGQEYIQLIQT